MTKKEMAEKAVGGLEKIYVAALCSLIYEKPYELMVAGRLSAQCTDARVNIVTEVLFDKYDTLEKLAEADISDIEEIIRPCGLYKTKAKSVVGMAKRLLCDYKGEIPDSIDELLTFPGIGRKTANLIMGDIHKKPAVVADTHCMRISRRLWLTDSDKPEVVEKDLKKILPPEKSSDFCHRLVLFGREWCAARNPRCAECPLKEFLAKPCRLTPNFSS